jgi:hypothetical protein
MRGQLASPHTQALTRVEVTLSDKLSSLLQ